jgi:hypothetical protein
VKVIANLEKKCAEMCKIEEIQREMKRGFLVNVLLQNKV